jgi:phosphonoacetaldehyde hydrolase
MSFSYQRRYTGLVHSVIFDWAGTTVDFGCIAPVAAFIRVFEQNQVAISVAEARLPMGAEKRDHIKALLAMPRIAEAWAATHGGKAAGESEIDRLYAEFLPLQVGIIADHAAPIPGCLDTVGALRAKGVRIAGNTGYARPMMEALMPAAAKAGYAPDIAVCASDVPVGRPGPGMALACAIHLAAPAVEACVKVGDTVVDVEEGLNAGMWSVAVAVTGNEVGLPKAELDALAPAERARRAAAARDKLARAGAHYVIDGIADLMPVIADIERRLASGERP